MSWNLQQILLQSSENVYLSDANGSLTYLESLGVLLGQHDVEKLGSSIGLHATTLKLPACQGTLPVRWSI